MPKWAPALNDLVYLKPEPELLYRVEKIDGMPPVTGGQLQLYTLARGGHKYVVDGETLRAHYFPTESIVPPVVGDIFKHLATQVLWRVVRRGQSEGDEHRLAAVGDAAGRWYVGSAFLYTEFEFQPGARVCVDGVAPRGAGATTLREPTCVSGTGNPAGSALADWVAERVAKGEFPNVRVDLPTRNETWMIYVSPCNTKLGVDGAWFDRVSKQSMAIASELQGPPAASRFQSKPSVAGAAGVLRTMVEKTEATQHAACLSIAEGAPGWETPTSNDSPAMVAVRGLRRRYEDKQREANRWLAAARALEDAKPPLTKGQVSVIVEHFMNKAPPEHVTQQAWQHVVLDIAEQLRTDWTLRRVLGDAHAVLEVYERARQKLLRWGK